VPAPVFDALDDTTDVLPALEDAIAEAYRALAARTGMTDPPVAVRSSAIDEDGALASFAGLHTTLLHITGASAITDAVARCRLLCAEIGRRMTQRGTLESADEIAFLTLSELVLWGFGLSDPLRPRVAQRKAEHEAACRITPPDYLGAPPEPQHWVDRFGGPPLPLDAEPGAIRGVGASAGRAVGAVRVARTFDEAQALQRGEVLVCPATDANWAPLFGVASALVTDTGGSLCHAAVLAREYHLPAVVGTHTATTQLQTGQRVEVDGLSGRIRLLDDRA
jgi:rifampicin phosphotransferase